MLTKVSTTAFAAVLFLFSSAFAGEIKIAVIDMQKALSDTEDGKAALQKLKAKLDVEYKVLQTKQEEVKKLEDELTQQGFMLSESTKAQKQEKLRQMAREFDKSREEKNKEFMDARNEATGKILKKLSEIIKSYAASEGFTVVLESSSQTQGMPGSVVWYDKKLEITDKVIELYNAAGKDSEKPR